MSSILNLKDLATKVRARLGLPQNLYSFATLAAAIVNAQGEVVMNGDNDGNLVDRQGNIIARANARSVKEDFVDTATSTQVINILPSGLVASGATGILHHIYTPAGNVFAWCPLGAGQTLRPVIIADGLDVGCDQTSTEGSEVFTNFLGASGRPFIVGVDKPFYFQCQMKVADISGLTSFAIGFRKALVNAAALATYTDYAALGGNASAASMALKQQTNLAGGGQTTTDTTQTLADATSYTVRVNVDKAGVVTFLHDAATPGVMLPPTTVAAFTLAAGTPVIPFMFALQGADLADNIVIQNWECGYQNSAQRK